MSAAPWAFVIPAVIAVLGDKDAPTRVVACQTLASIGGQDSLAPLRQLAKSDPDEQVRRAAETAITDLTRSGKVSDAASDDDADSAAAPAAPPAPDTVAAAPAEAEETDGPATMPE